MQINKDNPLPFDEYKKKVESVTYRGLSLKIDPTAKYEGSLEINYFYYIDLEKIKVNFKTDFPIRSPRIKIYPKRFSHRLFKGFDNFFDHRQQASKADVLRTLKEIYEKYIKQLYN